ncbi:MAG: hypothetical protein COB78_05685 [Hyphomicrobiales bacterium]|nr:MAG: hypothetical protein COB78_05685 [Hyphomicrobiales bacterium]
MDLSVFVRLRDRFSGKLRGIMRGLNRLGSAAKRIGSVAGIIAGITFAGPAAEAAKFDQNLRDIAVTSGIARTEVDAWIASQRSAYEDLALLTAQYSEDVSGTAGQLRQAGLSDALIDQLMPSISKSAKAATADITDIGKVAFALSKNLDVPASQMEDALGKLVVAGKEGRFELKEMAKYFPALTAQLAGFGIKGQEAVSMLASGLQIAILGASDPAQAANNFQNFLQKVLAPDTVKRFADSGVDILAVMQDAAVKGINPIEAVIAKTEDLTGVSAKVVAKLMAEAKANGIEGADALKIVNEQLERIGAAGKLAELFGDQQVKAFLLPFLANIDEYKRIKASVDAAGADVIQTDFEIQMDGPASQRKIFTELGIQSARDFGDAFNSWLPKVNKHLLELRSYMQGLESDVPGAKNEILSFAAAGLIAAMGLGILGFVLPAVATGIGVVASLFAAAFSPIGLTIALLVGGAILIMKNWDKVAPYFDGLVSDLQASWEVLKSFGSGFGEGFMAELGPALGPLTELAGPIGNVAENILSMSKSLLSLFSVEISSDAARGLGEILGQFAGNSLGTAAAGLKLLVDTINYLVEGLQQLFNLISGKPIEWDVLAGTGEEVFSSIGDLLNSILKTVGDLLDMDLTIDWSALGATLDGAIQGIKDSINDLIGWFSGISWPSLPSWFGGGSKKKPGDPESYGPEGAWRGLDASNTRKPAIGPTGVSPISQRSNVQVGGQITIKVEGPGKVTSTQSANSKVPINAGRTVGSP